MASYAALSPWSLFAYSISSAVPSVMLNMPLVSRIYFPREILPLAAIAARLVDFALGSLVFLALLVWFRMPLYPVPPLVFLTLMGWTLATGRLGLPGWFLFGILFLWQLPHLST